MHLQRKNEVYKMNDDNEWPRICLINQKKEKDHQTQSISIRTEIKQANTFFQIHTKFGAYLCMCKRERAKRVHLESL